MPFGATRAERHRAGGIGPTGSGPSHNEVHSWRLGNVAVRLSVAVTSGMTEADGVAIGQHLNARAVK